MAKGKKKGRKSAPSKKLTLATAVLALAGALLSLIDGMIDLVKKLLE